MIAVSEVVSTPAGWYRAGSEFRRMAPHYNDYSWKTNPGVLTQVCSGMSGANRQRQPSAAAVIGVASSRIPVGRCERRPTASVFAHVCSQRFSHELRCGRTGAACPRSLLEAALVTPVGGTGDLSAGPRPVCVPIPVPADQLENPRAECVPLPSHTRCVRPGPQSTGCWAACPARRLPAGSCRPEPS